MTEEKFERTFLVSQPARLEVRNICGSVEVRAGEDGKINIKAVKQPGTGDVHRTEIELTQQGDGTVKIVTRFPDGAWSWMFGSHPCCVDYVIQAPRQCTIKVNGVSNTTRIEGFEGDTNVNSVSGKIILLDLTGLIRLNTVSGDGSAERVAGSIDLDTVSGDLEFKDSKLPSIKAHTVSGNLDLDTTLMDGPYKFSSVSGDVRMTLPLDTRCVAELHSVSGDLFSAFPGTGYHHHSGTKTIQVQGGGVQVYMKSVSGDLSLVSTGPIEYKNDRKNVSAEQRRSVLESLERGEMTVEEALTKL
jgi:hypothetical protein